MSEVPSVKWGHRADDFKDPLCTVEFKWKIEKFSSRLQRVDTFYESPNFSSDKLYSWCLRFFPNGENRHSSEGWFGLYLTQYRGSSCTADFVIGIEKVDGTKEFSKGLSRIDFYLHDAKGWTNFLPKDKVMRRKSQFLPSDTLTIWIWLRHNVSQYRYDLSVKEKTGTIEIEEHRRKDKKLQGSSMLTGSRKGSILAKKDGVSTNMKRETLKARKLVFKESSEVLSSIFPQDVAETDRSVMEIRDCTPDAFEIFSRYLLTGKVDNLSGSNMLRVYCLADRHRIPDLKYECASYIKSSMSVETVCSIMFVARRRGDEELLNCATDYFFRNVKTVVHSEEWKLFIKKEPIYGKELFKKGFKYLK